MKWIGLCWFIKVLVGRIKNIRSDTFQPKIFGSKMKKRNLYTFHKSPGWKNQKHMNGHFSAKNIRFKIRKINNRLSPTNGVHSLCIIIPMPRFIG